MSTVLVNVGQCGNQIASELFKLLLNGREHHKGNIYTASDGKLRAVLVDSEAKVVERLLEDDFKRHIRQGNVVLGKTGRGTNWAMGYYDTEGDLLSRTLEAVRKESERCDQFSGVLLTHSLAGGTGSGLGSRLCEELRDELSLQYLATCTVAPFSSGESPLQHYNSLLSLSTLQQVCDAVFLFCNDAVLHRLSRSKALDKGDKSSGIPYAAVNQYIAASLASILLPNQTLTSKSGCSIGMEPWEMVQSVCPMPTLKFITTNHCTSSQLPWTGLADKLVSTFDRYDEKQKAFRSLSSLMIARGSDHQSMTERDMGKIQGKVSTSLHSVEWNPYPLDLWTDPHTAILGSRAKKGSRGLAFEPIKQLTLASNYSGVTQTALNIWRSAKVKWENEAFLHWYYRHGACKEQFEEAFNSVENVIQNYYDAVS